MECLAHVEGQSPLAKCPMKCTKSPFVGYDLDETGALASLFGPRFKWALYSNSHMKMRLADLVEG